MLTNQSSHFNLPHDVTYINCAYMSPQMKSVEEAGIHALRKKADPTSILPNDFFDDSESLRREFSSLLNCGDPNRIVIIPSVSYGMANVAKNVRLDKGEEIVILGEQFPSNYYSWKRLADEKRGVLKIVHAPDTQTGRGKAWNEHLLESISDKTRLVAISHVHWADGTLFDLEAIRKRTSDVGSLLIIDGTQSIGALPFDISKIKPDALVCGGYKWLLGPYSLGLAYYGEAFDKGIPIEENWINRKDSDNFAGLVSYQGEYQPGALRYEVGEHSNFNLVPMLLTAIKQLNNWSVDQIQSYCNALVTPFIDSFTSSGLWVEDEPYRSSHLFGIRLREGQSINHVQNNLKQQKISVSVRGSAIRVSPHLYNSSSDFQKLSDSLLS